MKRNAHFARVHKDGDFVIGCILSCRLLDITLSILSRKVNYHFLQFFSYANNE